jgi:two-component system CheB/CheR fusion protein
VGGGHELIHSYGEVHPFLRIREGQASLDINRILPDNLIPVAAAMLFKSARENTSVSSDIVRVELPHAPDEASAEPRRINIRLSAWPVGMIDDQRLTLLAFEPVGVPERGSLPATVDVHSEATERLEVLEQELAATRESLQATIEELETSNEELQATNEEMMASNEELQSSNEELQSVNEELNTVNAEYQEKIDILNRLNADLDSLARVVSSGTVFVDERLQLTRFSPDAAQIFRLRDSDIGRPLADLTHSLEYADFLQDLRLTLQTGQMIEKDVRGVEYRRYLVKMLPYRVPSSAARGVVISFVDMTSVHEAHRLQAVLDALGERIAVLDPTGRVVMANTAWKQAASGSNESGLPQAAPNLNYLSACNEASVLAGGGSAVLAAHGLQAVLNGTQPSFSMEYNCDSSQDGHRYLMHVNALPSEAHLDGAPAGFGAVVTHIDITGNRNAPA